MQKTMNLTLQSYLYGIENKQFSAKEVLDTYLKKAQTLNPQYNAFIRLHTDYIEKNWETFSTRELKAAPIALKDNILTKGYISSCGSHMLENYVAPYSATCFSKLENAGALMFGKTNMDEFAMGSSTETSYFGKSINPHGKDRVPGGSSGGSAIAVAADMCLAALGTDTGGSIRQPAALCGIVGMKPTYGRISRYGVQSMASSLDQVGTLTKNITDARILLNVMAGHDSHDATTLVKELPVGQAKPASEFRIAIPQEYMGEGLDPRIKATCEKIILQLQSQGAQIDYISLPTLRDVTALYYIIMSAESSTNLARFDGLRFGHQAKTHDFDTLHHYIEQMRSEGFGEEVKRRILLGTYVLSSANYDGLYKKAEKIRAQLTNELLMLYEKYDVILGPTTPDVAWKIGAKSNDPVKMYLSDLYTIPANLAGCPALSMPIGMIEDQGEMLPVGLQLMAAPWREDVMFDLGELIESMQG